VTNNQEKRKKKHNRKLKIEMKETKQIKKAKQISNDYKHIIVSFCFLLLF